MVYKDKDRPPIRLSMCIILHYVLLLCNRRFDSIPRLLNSLSPSILGIAVSDVRENAALRKAIVVVLVSPSEYLDVDAVDVAVAS